MPQKVAVSIIHGIGRALPGFADEMIDALQRRCVDCGGGVVIRPVYWSPVFQETENALWQRLSLSGPLDFSQLRHFTIDFVADAIAYQITPHDRYAYDGIHGVFAQTLRLLAEEAGPRAPLCIIAHSLGTIIASNYVYDLQSEPNYPILPATVRAQMSDTPLERGETVTLFYTLGSPIALWSLRYRNFGRPVAIPDPRLQTHYPALAGEWINFYDEDDVVGFPLKTLNDAYYQAVTADRQVNVGHALSSWNPASHLHYWLDDDVLDPIASGIIRVWQAVNQD